MSSRSRRHPSEMTSHCYSSCPLVEPYCWVLHVSVSSRSTSVALAVYACGLLLRLPGQLSVYASAIAWFSLINPWIQNALLCWDKSSSQFADYSPWCPVPRSSFDLLYPNPKQSLNCACSSLGRVDHDCWDSAVFRLVVRAHQFVVHRLSFQVNHSTCEYRWS